MTTDINSVILSLNLDMQQAATAHFRSLPASEECTRLADGAEITISFSFFRARLAFPGQAEACPTQRSGANHQA
jgi:hypothetical protein